MRTYPAIVMAAMMVGISWLGSAQATDEASGALEPDPAALARWRAMRFGMFVHWGPVSLTGTEIGWSRGAQVPIEEYDRLYERFNPTNFNADAWVEIAKAAGMKYLVFTTKHHDGFCMWATRQTDYNIMRSPFGRDVVRELADACRRGGLAFGTYHSVCDWYHPDFPRTSPGGKVRREVSNIARYRDYLRAQVRELITGYGPLLTMWFDVPQEFDRTEGEVNVRLCRALQPDILVNNRAGGGAGDYDTPEQKIGAFRMDRPWETCMTIGRQWAWKPNDQLKSAAECVKILLRTIGGDGNLLLNVGPTPTGEIEDRQVERLREIGRWIEPRAESVYGTRGGPWKPARHVVSTRRDRTAYVHVLDWPSDTVRLPPPPARVVASRVVGPGRVRVVAGENGIELTAAAADRDPIATTVALELDRPAMEIEPIPVPNAGGSLAEGRPARASNVYRDSPEYQAAMAVDGDVNTRWATDAGVGECWLEVDLGTPQVFDRAVIRECVDYGVRVEAFELQVQENGQWRTFHQGGAIGPELSVSFPAVTGRVVRLHVTKGRNGPTIREFELHAPASR